MMSRSWRRACKPKASDILQTPLFFFDTAAIQSGEPTSGINRSAVGTTCRLSSHILPLGDFTAPDLLNWS
jgi:hypothetical protein